MTLKIRNQYQMFLIQILELTEMDEVFSLGQHFANLENELGRTPTAWEVISTF